jgi:two-component system phosphate regulon response regulator OmpR
MLQYFARAEGRTVSRDELIGLSGKGSSRAVDVHINRLRRKIEQDPSNPRLLQTVRGLGYRLRVGS